MKLAKTFGRVLQEARLQKGFTQEELAEKCGLDRTYISLLERGLRQPTLNSLFLISKNLDLTTSDLIKKVEDKL